MRGPGISCKHDETLALLLCLLGARDDLIDFLAELRLVDERAVEHGAPVASDRCHRDRLANLGVGRAAELGGLRVELDAELAGNLGRNREADELLALAVERRRGIELHGLELAPRRCDAFVWKLAHERRHAAERE